MLPRELTPDERRLLVFMYECEQSGRRPNLDDTDMTREQCERAMDGLCELGLAVRA